MLKLRKKFEAWMRAITKKRFSFDRIMTAVTFAEAGEHNVAREYLGMKPEPERSRDLDIPGVRIWYGSVAMETVPIDGVRIWIGTVTA